MTDGPTTALMRKAYARWAPIYDIVYDKLTEPAARAAVNAAVACGPRVLEAGVGTGLSLGYYPARAEVYGVDLSEDMLRRAQDKVEKRGLTHVKSLQVMDVTRLGFPDGMFDAVTAQFIITLVPEPEVALSEFARVLRPGGEIILANHFGQPSGPIAALEELASPVAKAIGWSSAFKASRVETWARRTGCMEVVELKPLFPAGFFKLMRIRKQA
ncbi:class I SAM-dependent methyltransferase [Microvirga sp. 17 mud 1-3]|uniref:class I SAM-dependent methyltransferase n=1 Tax=Microvirga sp. 17 mud 1-3 TaxID=2082949 RepID=UPI000D6D5BA8|nr:class I SAM-dependent methyltransferase [Microvirga sp. 17 mud 1-3]AWM86090.1 SAM-dependent methyltransferase [Microvirga sp. 17 mud 1-3]